MQVSTILISEIGQWIPAH